MLKEVIENEIDTAISNKFPHSKLPQVVLGIITKGGDSEVNLKILDEYKNIDTNYAEIPRVQVDRKYETGDKVVVLFLFGKLEMPHIIKEYKF